MADVTTTRTQIAAEVNALYNRTLMARSVPFLVHLNWAQIRDIPANSGTDTIKFRKYGNLTAATTALTEGVTPPGSQLSITDITATVAQYGDYVTLTDKVLFSTPDPILTETAEILGDQVGDTLDQLTRDVMIAGTTVQYASTATQRTDVTAAMKLTATEVRKAVRTLQQNKAFPLTRRVDPNGNYGTIGMRPSYVAIISPSTYYDLKSDSAFVPTQKYPNQADVMEYEVGSVDEVRFVLSHNAKIYTAGGNGGVDVHGTLIMGRDYYGVTRITGESLRNIVKPLGSAGTADPLDQRTTSGWKATFVAKRLNEAFAVRVEHGVTA
jgi:N4-gp56 family major capsid protein